MSEKSQAKELRELVRLVRYFILRSTALAGSGHPTSSLSAAELLTVLYFGGHLKYHLEDPTHPNNDRVIFSKGHAAPLLYSLYAAAGAIKEEELWTLRKFGSRLEGHPTPAFPYAEAATGSLGQGLSIGVGFALNAKYLDKLPYHTYVLLGDGEMMEGSNWEAAQIASHYNLSNLTALVDVSRLEQTGESVSGWHLDVFERKFAAFGWGTIKVLNGNSLEAVGEAFKKRLGVKDRPVAIIAKTRKGKGVSFIENKDGWHGKALSPMELDRALAELGEIDRNIRGGILKPEAVAADLKNISDKLSKYINGPEPKQGRAAVPTGGAVRPDYKKGEQVATRKAYGRALAKLEKGMPELVVLDAGTENSTFAEIFEQKHPDKFFEMFIAEQNMIGAANGLALRGKIPFVSTFAAFLTRAHDQIRMGRYSNANIKIVGSHAGVSIGEDGISQMGLEDLSLMRSVPDMVVLYPSDAVAAEKLVEKAAEHRGMVYVRTTRMATPVIYDNAETFPIGGAKVVKKSPLDKLTIVAAGVTLHEALKAYQDLKKKDIHVRVIDLYSIKPLDEKTLLQAAKDTKTIITVEDHYPEGGLGEAVRSALVNAGAKVHSLAVRKLPKSGTPSELLDYEGISAAGIVAKVEESLAL